MSNKKKGRVRRKTGVGFILVSVLILFGVISYKMIDLDSERKSLAAQKAEYEKELEELTEEHENIDAYKAYVYSDENLESIARKKLGLVYPDEVVFEADDE